MNLQYQAYWQIDSTYREYDPSDQLVQPASVFCNRCHCLVHAQQAESIHVALHDVQPCTILWCGRKYRVALISFELWRQVLPYVAKSAVAYGSVSSVSGSIDARAWVLPIAMEPSRTYLAGEFRPEFGSPSYRVCPRCNKVRYISFHDPHVVASRMPKHQDVIFDQTGRLLIAEPIAKNLDWSGSRDLKYTRVPVRDVPLDGVPLGRDEHWSHLGVTSISMHIKMNWSDGMEEALRREVNKVDSGEMICCENGTAWINVYCNLSLMSPYMLESFAKRVNLIHGIMCILHQDRVAYYWHIYKGRIVYYFQDRVGKALVVDQACGAYVPVLEELAQAESVKELGRLIAVPGECPVEPGRISVSDRFARMVRLLGIDGVPTSFSMASAMYQDDAKDGGRRVLRVRN